MLEPDTETTTTVVKVGGARLADTGDLDRLVDHVSRLRAAGQRPLVVHGGGPEISRLAERLGVAVTKHRGLRVTRGEGMEATVMILCGTVRTRILERFAAHDVPALGVSGVDLGLLRAPLLDADVLGRVGGPPAVDAGRLRRLLELDAVLVVTPVSLGPDGRLVNVNADDAAHALATALGASSLDFVSDVPGVRDTQDAVLARIAPGDVGALVDDGVVRGGMVPKLRAAAAAVRAGVGRVRIGDLATLTDGRATEITATAGATP
jgi:acetylglutamate kinase